MIALAESIGAFAAMGVGGGGGFFAVKWFVEWLSGRMDKREARIVAALLENNQTPYGIVIPKVLQPYTRFEAIR